MFKIGSIVDTSLIDYPKKISSVFFLQGCNLHCPYCHNKELIPMSENLGVSWVFPDFLHFLKQKKGRIDAIVFSGGEPSIYEDNEWVALLKEIKDQTNLQIKIDTNGLDPGFIKSTMPYVDMYAIDIKTVPDKYLTHLACCWPTAKIEAKLKLTKSLLEDFRGIVEYRTTMYKPLFENFNDLIFMNNFLPSRASWYLQNYVGEEGSYSKDELLSIAKQLKEKIKREILIRSYK